MFLLFLYEKKYYNRERYFHMWKHHKRKEEKDERKNKKNSFISGNVFMSDFFILSHGGISYECFCHDQMESTDFKYNMF